MISSFKVIGSQRPLFNIIICTEEYYKNWDLLESQNNQAEILILGVGFISYIVMLVPLYLKRKKNESKDVKTSTLRRAVPKSLESLLLNLGFVGLLGLSQSLFGKMNK